MKVWTRIPILAALLSLPLAAVGADGADGMVTTQSNHSVAMTADKLVSTLKSKSVAIDLPQKALIWEDSEGTVWLGYNDPEYLKQRHSIEGCDQVIEKIEGALAGFAKAATE